MKKIGQMTYDHVMLGCHVCASALVQYLEKKLTFVFILHNFSLSVLRTPCEVLQFLLLLLLPPVS